MVGIDAVMDVAGWVRAPEGFVGEKERLSHWVRHGTGSEGKVLKGGDHGSGSGWGGRPWGSGCTEFTDGFWRWTTLGSGYHENMDEGSAESERDNVFKMKKKPVLITIKD